MLTDHDEDITEVRPRPDANPVALPYEVVGAAKGHLIVTAGNYLVHVVTGRPDVTAVSALVKASEKLCAQYEQFGFLSQWADDAAMHMSKELRTAVDGMVSRFSARYGAAAIVFGGQGFAATAARSIVTSVNLSTQSTHPNRVFTDLDSALPWLREKFPAGTVDGNTLRAIVRRLEAELLNTELQAANVVVAPGAARAHGDRLTPVGPARGILR